MILYCDPKGRRALLRIPSTVGRRVCLCWAKSKPKGPKGSSGLVSRLTAAQRWTDTAFSRTRSALGAAVGLSALEGNSERFKIQGPESGLGFSYKSLKLLNYSLPAGQRHTYRSQLPLAEPAPWTRIWGCPEGGMFFRSFRFFELPP